MHNIFVHAIYGFLTNARMENIWVRILFLVPVMEVFPLLLLGSSYLQREELEPFLYANMTWSLLAAVIIQCLVSVQGITSGTKLDALLLMDGGVLKWLVGYTLGVCGIYLVSTSLSALLLGIVLGFPVYLLRLIGCAFLAVPVTLALVFVVFGFEIRFNRTFHFINLLLDVLQTFSCVIFPLAALNSAFQVVSVVSPITHLNEYIRDSILTGLRYNGHLLIMFALSFVFLLLGMGWVKISIRRYTRLGKIGG